MAVRLRQEARRCYPREACGFLLGDTDGDTASARSLRPEANNATRADRFLIPARAVFDALRAARGCGVDIIAVYHSHPGGTAQPSATDADEVWGEWLHVIVPCGADGAGDPRCWRVEGDGFAPVDIEQEDH